MEMSVVIAIEVSDRCLQTFVCQHEVRLVYSDGTSSTSLMDGEEIIKYWDLLCKMDKNHFKRYREKKAQKDPPPPPGYTEPTVENKNMVQYVQEKLKQKRLDEYKNRFQEILRDLENNDGRQIRYEMEMDTIFNDYLRKHELSVDCYEDGIYVAFQPNSIQKLVAYHVNKM